MQRIRRRHLTHGGWFSSLHDLTDRRQGRLQELCLYRPLYSLVCITREYIFMFFGITMMSHEY